MTSNIYDINQYSPPVQNVLKFFAYRHLPQELAEMSESFYLLAYKVASKSSNAETTVALRKLLEGKDAAVRSLLP